MSIVAVLSFSAVAVANVFLASAAVAIWSPPELVRTYYALSAAALVCTALVVAILVQLLVLSRLRAVVELAEPSAYARAALYSLTASGLFAGVVAVAASLAQSRFLHIAMYGAS